MNQLVQTGRKSRVAAKTQVKPQPSRTNDPERTMAGILEVATREFADKGLSGGRIDAIAEATHTSKRMIYYYYGSKEGLYVAVLENAYRQVRQVESEQHLENMPPMLALRRLVEFTFDHHQGNQDFIRLVMSENIQRGQYLAQSKSVRQVNQAAIDTIEKLYQRGVAEGVFRTGLDPLDIHASISALSFFNVSNQYTFGLIFDRDVQTVEARSQRRASIVDMVVRFVGI